MISFPCDSILLPNTDVRWVDLFGTGFLQLGVAVSVDDATRINKEMSPNHTVKFADAEYTGLFQTFEHSSGTESTRGLISIFGDRISRSEPHFHEVVVHEVMHVWREYLDIIEEERPGAEIEAYGVQMLYKFAVGEYDRRTRTR